MTRKCMRRACLSICPRPMARAIKISPRLFVFPSESTDPKGVLPEVGQDTMAVLEDLGLDEDTRARYLEAKVIGQYSD